jgi:hypothetical protein
MSKNIDAALDVKAVENAYMSQRPKETLILHSDLYKLRI